MKTLKVLFLSIMIFLSFNSLSQDPKWYVDTNWQKISETPLFQKGKWLNNSPGDELKKYSRHFYLGTAFTIIGGGLIYLGIEEDSPFAFYSGSALSLSGTILILEAPLHIKRAGVIMNKNGIGIQMKL